MKKFNINDYVYIQITQAGFEHLKKTVGKEYIEACIYNRKVQISNQIWYRLQCHNVFELFPINFGGLVFFNTNIMLEESSLKPII